MRVLIDEYLDWRLCRALTEHHCSSVRTMGWVGLANGALLERAEQEFDVFITGDLNLSFQQQVSRFAISVVVLRSQSTRLRHTLALMPKVLLVLPVIEPGQVIDVYP